MRVTVIPIVIGVPGTVPMGLKKKLEEMEIRRWMENTHYSIVEISQNSEKSPEDLRRLAVSETLVKENQLTLVWKTRKYFNNNNNNLK